MRPKKSFIQIQRILDSILGGVLILLFRPISLALEPIMKRDHELVLKGTFVVVKILGGGSLFVAAPSLMALRKKYPDVKFKLVCSNEVKVFAELLGVFDVIIPISTSSSIEFLKTSFIALRQIFRCDTILDLEIYSKLTSIFCLFSCARNRIGFFMNINSWQSGLTTHSLFLNHSAPIYTFYEQAVLLLGATALSTQESRDILKSVHPWMSEVQKDLSSYTIAPFSSLLAPEREFSSEEWAEILSRNKFPENAKLTILGGNADVDRAAELEILLSTRLRDVNIVNMAGKLKLVDSAHEIFKSNRLFAIDSGLNHIARLFGTDVTSYWGPTNPNRFLKPMSGIDEEVHYKPPYCSPCVHLIDSPPCAGNNICMKNHLSMSQSCLDGWLIKGTRS